MAIQVRVWIQGKKKKNCFTDKYENEENVSHQDELSCQQNGGIEWIGGDISRIYEWKKQEN